MSLENPYIKLTPVDDPARFWGRTMEVARIFSRIGAERPQSVSLIGEPGMGKTSLVRHIMAPGLHDQNMEDPEHTVIVGLEVPADLAEPPERFIERITGLIAGRLGVKTDGPGYDGFLELMKDPALERAKLIICLDDFHHVTENPNYPMEFFSFLRSAANNYNVAYVTTSPLELQRLCVSQVVEESPFFNIFTNIPLRPLPMEEARKAIAQPSAAAGRSLASLADRIIAFAGAAPDDLRAACAMLFDRIGDAKAFSDGEWAAFEADYLAERGAVLDARWNALGAEHRRALLDLSAGRKIDRSRKYLVTDLERKGYVGREADGFPVLCRAFVRHGAGVSGEKTPGPGKKGGWLKKLFG